MHQSMSFQAVVANSKIEALKYAARFQDGSLTLEDAHHILSDLSANKMDLFQIAGLAQALACFQCTAP